MNELRDVPAHAVDVQIADTNRSSAETQPKVDKNTDLGGIVPGLWANLQACRVLGNESGILKFLNELLDLLPPLEHSWYGLDCLCHIVGRIGVGCERCVSHSVLFRRAFQMLPPLPTCVHLKRTNLPRNHKIRPKTVWKFGPKYGTRFLYQPSKRSNFWGYFTDPFLEPKKRTSTGQKVRGVIPEQNPRLTSVVHLLSKLLHGTHWFGLDCPPAQAMPPAKYASPLVHGLQALGGVLSISRTTCAE